MWLLLKVEIFACTNFRDRNFRENLFSWISRIWKKFAKFAKICFREIFQNYEIREIYHKNSLIWKMNNSYMHQCIKETFLQCFGNRLCLWRQILGLKKIVFKSRNGDDREIRENKLSRKKWKVQSRKLIVAKFCFRENLYTRSFLPLR